MGLGSGFGSGVRRLLAALGVSVAALGAVPSAHAFVLMRPDGMTGADAMDLTRVVRWSMTEEAFLEGGEPGIGGGLEYSIASDFCTRLTFIDPEQPDCAAIHAAVAQAFDQWTAGHPVLRFVDVTDKRPALIDGAGGLGREGGAEIDLLAMSGDEYRPLDRPGRSAFTAWRARKQPVLLTSDRRAVGPRLVSADIVFKADTCWYLDPAAETAACDHFPSTMLHEIAHVLGLGHPDELASQNLDTDDDPLNAMSLDCTDPTATVRFSPRYDPLSLAARSFGGTGRWQRGLRHDDRAGRDFLYPYCPEQVQAALSDPSYQAVVIDTQPHDPLAWGSVVRSGTWSVFASDGHATPEEARRAASLACSERAENCTVIRTFSACFAVAKNHSRVGWAVRENISSAERMAEGHCGAEDCAVSMSFCTNETG